MKISTATLAKLSKNEPIAMKVIKEICNFLNCQPGDIMEMEKEVDKTTLLYAEFLLLIIDMSNLLCEYQRE